MANYCRAGIKSLRGTALETSKIKLSVQRTQNLKACAQRTKHKEHKSNNIISGVSLLLGLQVFTTVCSSSDPVGFVFLQSVEVHGLLLSLLLSGERGLGGPSFIENHPVPVRPGLTGPYLRICRAPLARPSNWYAYKVRGSISPQYDLVQTRGLHIHLWSEL